jgi:hypothetical protein
MKTNSPFIMAVGSLVSKTTEADINRLEQNVEGVAENVAEELLQDAEEE